MALVTQALSCPQQCVGAPSACSTSCQDRTSSATGLRLNRRSFTTSQTVVTVNYVSRMGSSKWRAAASSADFQSTFIAKELERDAAEEALLLAIADAGGRMLLHALTLAKTLGARAFESHTAADHVAVARRIVGV